MSEGRRWMPQLKERANPPFAFVFYSALRRCLPAPVREIFFTRSTASNIDRQ